MKDYGGPIYEENTKNIESFKCPIGFSNADAMCIECNNARPLGTIGQKHIGEENINGFYLTFPGWEESIFSIFIPCEEEYVQQVFERIFKGKTCDEWKKKHLYSFCGCGGQLSCICGYYFEACYAKDGLSCPFCGRLTTLYGGQEW